MISSGLMVKIQGSVIQRNGASIILIHYLPNDRNISNCRYNINTCMACKNAVCFDTKSVKINMRGNDLMLQIMACMLQSCKVSEKIWIPRYHRVTQVPLDLATHKDLRK